MITVIDNALELGSLCKLVSCHFDVDDFSQQSLQLIESTFGVALPQRLEKAVAKRQAEFIAGRYCARQALQSFNNAKNEEVKIGEKREPLWPQGFTGSITHSRGFAAAAIAQLDIVRSIGIDSEQTIKTSTADNVSSHILTTSESYQDNQALFANSSEYLTLVFSAKESIFKCLYPLVNRYFDFKDAIIFLDTSNPGAFTYELQKDLNDEFTQGYRGVGCYRYHGDFVHTGIVLPQ